METAPQEPNRAGIIEPPTTWRGRLRHIGPGLISTASIVGSGELIATTVLGARAGFVALWIILVSCLIKVFIQLEFGKQAILSNRTTMGSFNELGGWRLGNGHWTLWAYVLVMVTKFFQYGGIVGGVALILNMLFPALVPPVGALVVGLTCALAVHRSFYRHIEGLSIAMTMVFTVLTAACVVTLQWTPFAISAGEVHSGLSFQLPVALIGVAIAAFGITGVSADEIVIYPYWCLEKGYARQAGPPEDTEAWRGRVRGWIRVMEADAFFSMIVYTMTTVAFYLLGAAVLNRQGIVPEGFETVRTLSRMYTDTLGPWAMYLFLAGAFAVLLSTLFVSIAGWSRVFADAVALMTGEQLGRAPLQRLFTYLFPAIWVLVFAAVERPVFLVLIGGVGTAFLLLILAGVAVHYRWWQVPIEFRPPVVYDIGLGLSILLIAGLGLISLVQALQV